MGTKVCCFIGHRDIEETEKLTERLRHIIENLILKERVATFLFGSKSAFNDLCYETVSDIKEKHPFVKRVFVRAEYPEINDSYLAYLHKFYEETYYPQVLLGSGRAAYIKRNQEMIKISDFCVFYYNEEYSPKGRKSGTKIAFNYAKSQNKIVINLP